MRCMFSQGEGKVQSKPHGELEENIGYQRLLASSRSCLKKLEEQLDNEYNSVGDTSHAKRLD